MVKRDQGWINREQSVKAWKNALSHLKGKGMWSHWPGQTWAMERSPLTCNCKEGVRGHHGGSSYSSTMADAQAPQLFHPRSRCPEAMTEKLCCSQHPSSSCKLLLGPSIFSYSHPCKEKHSIKVGQRGRHLPVTVDKMLSWPWVSEEGAASPPALSCDLNSSAVPREMDEHHNRKQLLCEWSSFGAMAAFNFVLRSPIMAWSKLKQACPFEHETTDLQHRVKKQASTGHNTSNRAQTGVSLWRGPHRGH